MMEVKEIFKLGEGTIDSPYLIFNIAQLNAIRYLPRSENDAIFLLAADIFADETKNWITLDGQRRGFEPISETFYGILSGGGHVIRNLTIAGDINSPDVLFSCVAPSGMIENLYFENLNCVTDRKFNKGRISIPSNM